MNVSQQQTPQTSVLALMVKSDGIAVAAIAGLVALCEK